MTTLAEAGVPVAKEALVRQYASTLVLKSGPPSEARVLLLRAQPSWDGPDSLTVPGPDSGPTRVLVRTGVSALAVREAMGSRPPDDYLIVLTDRSDADLGLGIRAHCYDQRVVTLTMWVGVEQAFRARQIDPALKRKEWAAEPLVVNAPAEGWPFAPAGVLTRDHALACLTGAILGLPGGELDPSGILAWTLDTHDTAGFRSQDRAVQSGLIDWVTETIGPIAGLALRAVAQGRGIDALTIGLTADVLWSTAGRAGQDLLAARVRLEPFTGMPSLGDDLARALADASRGALLRMAESRDPALPGILARAEALFIDLGYPAGAALSDVLPAGFEARLRALADVTARFIAVEAPISQVEAAFGLLAAHERAAGDLAAGVARMAVRLARWLATGDGPQPTSLLDAMLRQARTDAWVDWAAADVWDGSTDPQVAAGWSALVVAVRERRRSHDRSFAALLADATARGVLPDGLVPVERLVREVVLPLAAGEGRVLLVVVDGMSTAVAAELAEETLRAGWYEVVPRDGGGRTATLAALPTLTRYSRTSLFAGELASGQQADEKRLFPALTGGGQVFHKSDLVGPAGESLPAAVRAALDSADRVVAVVLNSVDDALSKADPGGTDWTLSSVRHLPALLEVAARAGRTVVLTSDHGHVVERGGEARALAEAEARWRPVATGPVDGDREVLLTGNRVLAEGGSIVAAWIEDLRYAGKQAGYHGGASAAEAVIPVIALTRQPDSLDSAGWVAAAPQAPQWWNDAVSASSAGMGTGSTAVTSRPRRKSSKDKTVELDGQIGLDVEAATPAPTGAADPASTLAQELISSPIYQAQRARYGARATDDGLVGRVVTLLAASGGRMHRDSVASAAGIPAARMTGVLSALRRQLNLEGYEVISIDPDQVTVLLDTALLRVQFLTGGPG